jgi:hypothetical protein
MQPAPLLCFHLHHSLQHECVLAREGIATCSWGTAGSADVVDIA